uniref:Hypoxanthine-guanine phosphoribosyltransferase n=1 Tax=Schistosoma haematobium TaxID=6185 RepID=A0A094ZJJ5_SCHHA
MSMDIVDHYEACNATSITLMCVLKGGFKFLADLVDGIERTIRARGIVLPMSVEFVRVKSYVNDVSIHEPILTGLGDPSEYKDKHICVINEVGQKKFSVPCTSKSV